MSDTATQQPPPASAAVGPTMRKYSSAANDDKDKTYQFALDGEVFTCYPWRLSPGLYLEMTVGEVSTSSRAMWKSFENILGNQPTIDPKTNAPRVDAAGNPLGEFVRFRDFAESDERRVEVQTLVAILADVYVEASGRPT